MKKFILGDPAPKDEGVADDSIANSGRVILREPSINTPGGVGNGDPDGEDSGKEYTGDGENYINRPSVYVHNAPDGMQDIPQEGHAHIKYKVVGKSEHTDSEGNTRRGMEIEIHHFTPKNRSGDSDKPSKPGKKSSQEEADEAFDNYEKEAQG
jgi:hypothetical protein